MDSDGFRNMIMFVATGALLMLLAIVIWSSV